MTELSETDQIERDLAETRARMDHRLDELQDRLSPGQVVSDALAYVTGGDGDDFTHGVVAKLKANPLPALLTGVGLVWLALSSSRHPSAVRGDSDGHPESGPPGSDASDGRLQQTVGAVRDMAKSAAETAASYSDAIKDTVASATQSLRETSHDMRHSAASATGNVIETIQRGSVSAQGGMETMVRSIREASASVTGNPVALGAVAAMVGLIAGALLPTAEQEERALGGTADRLRAAGRDLAQDVVDRGGRAASDALAAVKDSAEAHGLTAAKPIGEVIADLKSGDLVGAITQVAGEAVDAGKQAAQTHFGSDTDEQPQNAEDIQKQS